MLLITEPDVMLTDYFLTLECFAFLCLLYRKNHARNSAKMWFQILFCSLGLSAFFGGTVHGFFLDPLSLGHTLLWPLTMIMIGVSALALWAIGAVIQFSGKIRRWIIQCAMAVFIAYSFVAVFLIQPFWLAIADYLPAIFFLIYIYLKTYIKTHERRVLAGFWGLTLTLVAAVIQHAKIAIHPTYFNHNALYHLVQAIALFMLFYSASWFIDQECSSQAKS